MNDGENDGDKIREINSGIFLLTVIPFKIGSFQDPIKSTNCKEFNVGPHKIRARQFTNAAYTASR